MEDKSINGIRHEVETGIAKMAFWSITVLGIDYETFKDWLEENCPTNFQKIKIYMNFRNSHPEYFNA